MADSSWCLAETNTILESNYPQFKNKLLQKAAGAIREEGLAVHPQDSLRLDPDADRLTAAAPQAAAPGISEPARALWQQPGPQESLAAKTRNESEAGAVSFPKRKFLLVKILSPCLVEGPGEVWG